MSNILVTGCNGFVGRHLVTELSANNIAVYGPNSHAIDTNTQSSDSEFVDLTDKDNVKNIDFKAVDGVVHLAGLAAVGPSFNKPMDYIRTNMGIELNLFEEALRQKAFIRFLLISSGSLYDAKAPLPLTEASSTIPNSPYAVSKLGQEQLAAYYATRGFECIIARPFNHIGPGQGPGFIVPDLALQVLEAKRAGKNEVSVGNIETKRDYTDVRDIARAYRLLLEKGKPGETYNICSGKSLSGHQILSGLMDAADVSLKVKVDPAKFRPSDALDIYGSYEKLNKDTGWKPETPITQTLRDVIQSM